MLYLNIDKYSLPRYDLAYMSQNLSIARETNMFQRVQGKISWDVYIRLRKFVKQQKGRRIEIIIGAAIKEYLDKQGK